jgi:hypothetical protein
MVKSKKTSSISAYKSPPSYNEKTFKKEKALTLKTKTPKKKLPSKMKKVEL